MDVLPPNPRNRPDLATRSLLLLVFLPLLGVQLLIGASLPTVALCAVALCAGLLPFLLYGFDLYALLGIVFVTRYVGIALIAKTVYLQPLDENLHDPQASYALAALLMGIEASILLAVRSLDGGRSILRMSLRPEAMRRAASFAAVLGLGAQLVLIATDNRRTGIANTGGDYIICAALARIYLLALGLETMRSIVVSSGRQLMSLRLCLMLAILAFMTLALNMRQLLIDGFIVIAVTALLNKGLHIRHIAAGILLILLTSLYVSPMVLAMRDVKYGQTGAGFMALAGATVIRMATDGDFRAELAGRQKTLDRQSRNSLLYDYFGDGSNILNRLSYIGLLDAVRQNADRFEPIGQAAISEVWMRMIPRFLVPDKETRPYAYGDWLCWKIGLMPTGRIYAANFGLPMEGLAIMGVGGFILFPLLFSAPLLFLLSRLTTFRHPGIIGIFLFASVEHPMIEAASDGYIELLTRTLPLLVLSILLINALSGSYQSTRRKPANLAVPAGEG